MVWLLMFFHWVMSKTVLMARKPSPGCPELTEHKATSEEVYLKKPLVSLVRDLKGRVIPKKIEGDMF